MTPSRDSAPAAEAALAEPWFEWVDLWQTLTFQAGYNTTIVVLGTTLLGIATGTIGTFALLRKRALMGDALAHATLPGIALAFLLLHAAGQGKHLSPLLAGAAATGVLGVIFVQLIIRHTRLRADAAIGAVLSVMFGVGIVLLSYAQGLPGAGGLNHYIYGQTAAMQAGDRTLIAAVAIGAIVAAALLMKEFRAVCFDDRFAAAIGLPVWLIDLLMMALVVLVTVIGLQAVGLLLIVAMLIIPPAAARFWTERMGPMTILSAAIGGLSGYLGATASALAEGVPTGAVIVLTAGVLFALSMFVAPARGVIASGLRRVRLSIRISMEHVLRAMFERLEAADVSVLTQRPIAAAQVLDARTWGGVQVRALLALMRLRGLVTAANGSVRLTERGAEEAVRVTRNHRLWEAFLVRHADLAASHVDRAADLVEHALSPELVRELEAILRADGELPGEGPAPRSVHPIGTRDV